MLLSNLNFDFTCRDAGLSTNYLSCLPQNLRYDNFGHKLSIREKSKSMNSFQIFFYRATLLKEINLDLEPF